ncbi:hypothetical protein JTE90_003674 [Oedothorax gibbosus]|uniref:Uncharacterized protein n=1 Tax=Oedothorax gibbosus TaxID=931172 RepID=A0AAV6VU06_9ARAC|nr:hypothetical protein JTE90_003674 [Oedothorax gibbosus]
MKQCDLFGCTAWRLSRLHYWLHFFLAKPLPLTLISLKQNPSEGIALKIETNDFRGEIGFSARFELLLLESEERLIRAFPVG